MVNIGRVIRASICEFDVGCHIRHIDLPMFGGLVRVRLEDDLYAIGVIAEISLNADPLVQQIARLDQIDDVLLADNLVNRMIPARVRVITVGTMLNDRVLHRLPKRPPLLLEEVYDCEPAEIVQFTSIDGCPYLHLLVERNDLPRFDLLRSHIEFIGKAHEAAGNSRVSGTKLGKNRLGHGCAVFWPASSNLDPGCKSI